MNKNDVWDNEKLVEVLKNGSVAIMPTDTIYGIVGRAEDRNTVERIYKIRNRSPEKPCIALVGDLSELEKFSVSLTEIQKKEIEKYKEPTSFILDCPDEKFSYLHRGTESLAFRVPAPHELRDLLLKVGPLIAPSANLEDLSPAQNISEAREYFGDAVDLYIDGGSVTVKASKVIRLHRNGSVSIIRE